MKKFLLIGLGILTCATMNFADAMTNKPKGELVSFDYGLTGVAYKSGYQYDAKIRNDELLVHMYYYTSDGIVEKRRAVNGDTQFLKGLGNVIKEQELYKWDGFHKEDPNVLDGEGFSFRAKYKIGDDLDTISASGSNVFPDGFDKASKAVGKYFRENVSKLPTVKAEYSFQEVKPQVAEALGYMAEKGIIQSTVGGEVFAFSAKGDEDLALITVDIAMDPGHSFQLLIRNNKPIGLKVVAADGKNIEPQWAAIDYNGKLAYCSASTYEEMLTRKEF